MNIKSKKRVLAVMSVVSVGIMTGGIALTPLLIAGTISGIGTALFGCHIMLEESEIRMAQRLEHMIENIPLAPEETKQVAVTIVNTIKNEPKPITFFRNYVQKQHIPAAERPMIVIDRPTMNRPRIYFKKIRKTVF